MAVEVKVKAYGGWEHCYHVSNGLIELVATADMGPRLIRFGFVGKDNEFSEFPEDMGKTGGETYRFCGGHRLWHSPETRARTYFPDNAPVEVETLADGLRLTQPLETNCGIRKRMQVSMDAKEAKVSVRHSLTNEGVWPVEMAVWCISVMAPGGTSLVPQPTESDEEGLLPNRILVLWPYTDMSDPRYKWGKGLVRLSQAADRGPTKYGLSVTAGWGAYANRGRLFLKEFTCEPEAVYPDGGCSLEVYTNERMQELETLSPLALVEPGETITHTETWTLIDGFTPPADDAEAIGLIEEYLK